MSTSPSGVTVCRLCLGEGWLSETTPCLACGGLPDSWARDEDGESYQDDHRQGGTGHHCQCGGLASNDGATSEDWWCLSNDCDVAACPDRPCLDCGERLEGGHCVPCEAEAERTSAIADFRALWRTGA